MQQQKWSDIGIAVVGAGYWGRNFVRNFAGLSCLRMCCDTSQAVLDRTSRDVPGVRVTRDLDEVLRADDIHGVVLATPAVTHADLAARVLEADKDVFVEKPLALDVGEAERLVRLAEDRGRILMVGHLLEYHPAVGYLKQLIDSGELGDVYYCYSQRVNLGRVRLDENALWSLAPHDVSVILHLFGEEPVEVRAVGQSFLRTGVDDVVFVTMRFASGRVASIQASWLDPNKERRLTVVGSRKMVVFNDMEPREKVKVYDKGIANVASGVPAATDFMTVRDGDILIPSISSEEPLAIECREFLTAIATRVPPRSDGQDGLRVLRVLDAAQRSMESSAVVVEV